jgi:hypothetical protein
VALDQLCHVVGVGGLGEEPRRAAANGVDWYNMLCPSDLPFCQGALQRARDPRAAPPSPLSAADLALAAPGVDHALLSRLYGRHLFPFTQGAWRGGGARCWESGLWTRCPPLSGPQASATCRPS